MEKAIKQRWYSIFYLICVVLLLGSIPFSLLIENTTISTTLSIIFKGISLIYLLIFIKKEKLEKPKINNFIVKDILLLPLIILCFSNLIVILFTKTSINNNINYLNILLEIIITIFVAVIEEILFRTVLFKELSKTKKISIAIILQAFIFGSVHLLNISSLSSIPTVLVQVFYSAFLGFILGVIYYKTDNILYPIVYHFIFNFFNDVIIENLYNITWNYKFFIINIVVGLITLSYALLILKGGKKNVTSNLDN